MASIWNVPLQTHLNQTIIAFNPNSMFLSLSFLPHPGQIRALHTFTIHPLLLNFPMFQSFHLLKRLTSTVTLCTVLDMHVPPSLRKVTNHNSSPCYESIRDELLIAKRERRQVERKWRNTKLTIFRDLYRQAKHKVSILVHIAKCKFYTERIALASSSKELQRILDTLSSGHSPKILATTFINFNLEIYLDIVFWVIQVLSR